MDIFNLLKTGAHFDRKRFASDVQLFSKKRRANDGDGEAGAKGPTSFFSKPAAHAGGDSPEAPKHGKRARADAALAEMLAPEAAPAGKRSKKKAKKAKSKTAAAEQGDDAALLFGAAPIPSAAEMPDEEDVPTADPLEQAAHARRAHKIRVTGEDVPAPLHGFREMYSKHRCGKRLLANLAAAHFKEPTPIQRQAIPCLMAQREVLAVANTGSGKTLAFVLPILAALKAHGAEWGPGVKAVLLSPTRELSAQTGRVLALVSQGLGLRVSELTKATATGTDYSKVDIMLAQPLRLDGLLEAKKVDLSNVRFVILDEADKLFEEHGDNSFVTQIDAILAACTHKDVVRGLFSATLPDKVEALARSIMHDPIRITVGERNTAASCISQRLLFVGRENGKLLAVRQAIADGLKPPVLVFLSSKERVKALHRELMYDGVHVDSIRADQSTAAREAAIENFRLGKTWVLLATDLLARGMDFIGVNSVINYDFPMTPTDYIHRIGRTGRNGRPGEAVTFFAEDDAPALRAIANVMRAAGCEVPEWMLHMKKGKTKYKKPLPASTISTQSAYLARKAARRRDMIAASKKRHAKKLAAEAAGEQAAPDP